MQITHSQLRLLASMWHLASELEEAFAGLGLPFKPDGNPVGSTGEVLAAHIFGLELAGRAAQRGWDARHPDGRLVQIKATGGTREVSARNVVDGPDKPHLFIALRLEPDAPVEVVYAGDYQAMHDKGIVPPSAEHNGQAKISLGQLRTLAEEVPQLDPVHPPPVLA